ncbi:hypothetical protein QAD02_019536 [Eretmocerus hayati]|uniref:Uncharacterized protein n=1 Tax=Eretmocerus hayati TaxID=131215 RepID=A0ACC2PKB5_9HYME|nr:hypothetical protein QAD02_019536 [Eretmocerus hayati]
MFKVQKFNVNDNLDNSEFVYFGIRKALEMMVRPSLHVIKILKLQFNVDGLPISKSSLIEFWLIMGKIFMEDILITYDPFAIAAWKGKGKPKSVELFLEDFITELNIILQEGVTIQEVHFTVEVHCFACDKPARAFIKCTISHGGFFACERCYVNGCKPRDTTIYPQFDAALRTDQAFRMFIDTCHQKKMSPLVRIKPEIDMIYKFMLEFMHLGPLGLMKRLLNYWTNVTGFKLSTHDINRLSARMANIAKQVPCDFQRTTRSLGIISYWKATEFRFFLLYCGFLVLKDILPKEQYMHFMLF